MGIFLAYILKSAFCLALFYSFYRLLLSEETFHRFNRVALLVLLLSSFVLPMIELGNNPATEIAPTVAQAGSIVTSDITKVTTSEQLLTFGWEHTLLLIYLTGLLGCICYHLVSYIRLGMLLRKAHQEPIPECMTDTCLTNIKLHVHDEELSPFSWMNRVVVSHRSLQENGNEILRHELAHIRSRHSWDLLLVDICSLSQWFNPVIWLLKRELRTLHEYEADEAVIKGGMDSKEYQRLLIKEAVGTRLYSMANNLNHSSLKKRITMMLRKKSNPWARAKYLYVLPMAAVSVAVFARPEVSNKLDEISSTKVSELTSIAKTDGVKSVKSPSFEKVKISGKVVDERTGKPITGVNVMAFMPGDGRVWAHAVSKNGKFELDTYEGYVLKFDYVGMQSQKVVVPKGGIKSLTISMKEEVYDIPEMVVAATMPDDNDATYEKSPKIDKPSSKKGEESQFFVVSEDPQFPGGMGELMKYLSKNVKYPVAARQAHIQGKVIVEFLIKKDGSISDVKVKRSVNPELDAEAVRVIKAMPKWQPGKQLGEAVDVRYEMPIVFRLQK